MSMRAFMVRIANSQTFNGRSVVDFSLGQEEIYSHRLSASERGPQDIVKMVWDPAEKARLRGQTIFSPGGLLKRMTEARVGLLHIKCIDAGYSQISSQNEGEDEDEDDELDEIERKDLAEKRASFKERLRNDWKSSRMIHLIDDLQKYLNDDGRNKAIVLSEFLSHLDVVVVALETLGIQFLEYNGTMKKDSRTQAIGTFQNPENLRKRVFLVTTRSSSEGVDMTAAGRIYHISQPWNPALVAQANSRVIRPHQTKHVRVLMFHAESSMDDKTH